MGRTRISGICVRPIDKMRGLITTIALACFVLSGLLANEIYFPHATNRGASSIEIPSGAGSRQIAKILKKEGAIRSSSAFLVYVILRGAASNLQAGDYIFGRAAIPEIARALSRGGTNEIALIIPEGWNSRQIAERLEEKSIASREKFLAIVSERKAEGYLFPDTYRVFKDSPEETIIATLLANFEKKLTPELREEIKRRGKTISEIVIMASLIEKEVVSDEDRAIVSGILWKRLGAGIALQVDATISYITGKKTTNVSREETQIDSPYNTYKYRGLPRGPIGNPGLSAIRAAIYPKTSPPLYYLSRPDGKTIFSKTLEEHNGAKAKYLPPR